jgi:hypothetical protein
MLVTDFLFLRAKFQKETKEECVLTNHPRPYLTYIGPTTNVESTSISTFQKGCLRCMHNPEPKDDSLEAKKRMTTDVADVTSNGTNIIAFLSIVMSLTRPTWTTGQGTLSLTACLATGAYTSTVACPRVAARTLSCLQKMSNQATKFKGGDEIKCVLARVYRDACHDTHVDGERHGRIETAMCSRDIHARSVKTTTPSSTEDRTHYDQARLCRARTRQMASRYSRTSCQSVLQRNYCSDARRPRERWNWILTSRSNYRYVDS